MPRLLDPILPPGSLRDRPQPTLRIDDEVALRPWVTADLPVLVEAYADPNIAFWHHRSMSEDEAEVWIGAAADAWRDERDAEFAVVGSAGAGPSAGGGGAEELGGSRDVLGRVALRGIGLDIGHAEVSYWTLPHARRSAVATRGVDRLAHWALEEVGFWRLLIRHSTRNLASCRVAERAGFTREATLARCHIHADGWHDVHVHTRFRASASASPDRRG